MSPPGVGAVLFAANARSLAKFYEVVFGARVIRSDEQHSQLDIFGFELVVHQIPSHFLTGTTVASPPERRERGALRLDYPVADLPRARAEAERLGGQIDDSPPPWAGGDTSFFLGFDPEGNVFGAKRA